MGHVNQQALWKRKYTLSPGVATLLGVGFGWALAVLYAFAGPRDFSYSVLLILLVGVGINGGIFGYILWLCGEPARKERLQRITGIVALTAIVGLIIAFPGFWRALLSSPSFLVMATGGICGAAMFVVGAGLGIAHLVGHLASSLRKSTELGEDSWTDGVWDRELDQG